MKGTSWRGEDDERCESPALPNSIQVLSPSEHESDKRLSPMKFIRWLEGTDLGIGCALSSWIVGTYRIASDENFDAGWAEG